MSDAVSMRREAFRAFVEERGGVAKVARAANVPATTIYSYLTGKSQSLKGTTQDSIASAFDVASSEMFGQQRPRMVSVVGYVGAGDAAHYYSATDLDHVEAPENATPLTVAGEVRGPSIGRHFDGWLIFWDEVRSPVTPDLHGQLCVVGLPDERVLVKWLHAARTPGLYNLVSETEGPISDQEVAWAAKVTNMRPR